VLLILVGLAPLCSDLVVNLRVLAGSGVGQVAWCMIRGCYVDFGVGLLSSDCN